MNPKTSTSSSNLLPLIIGALAISLAGLSGYEYFQMDQLRKEVRAGQFSLSQSEALVQKLKDRIKELEQSLTAKPSESPEVAKTDTPTPEPAAAEQPAAQNDRAERRNAFREMLKGKAGELFAANSVNRQYADLFKGMKLTAQEKTELYKLLLDSQTARVRSDPRDATSQAQLAALQQANDKSIQALLGADRYKDLEIYNTQISTRTQVTQFQDTVAISSPLNDSQKQQMVTIISEEQQKASGADATQGIYNRLGTVLTPEQLSQYSDWQTTMSQMRGARGGRGGGGPPPGF